MATAINTNQRFARRAKCSHIWRDSMRCRNETQRRVSRSEVTVGTQWQYIPANTNHTGLWEASVRSLKYHLNGSGTKEVNYQANIKTMYYDNMVDDYATNVGVPFKDMSEMGECHMTRWQHTQKLVGDLWRRWKNELSRISTRPKCLKKEKDSGEYVFVNTANLQPGKWYFGTMEKPDARKPKVVERY